MLQAEAMPEALRLVLVFDDPLLPPDWCIRLVEQISAAKEFQLLALVRSGIESSGSGRNMLVRSWEALERRITARPSPADRAAYVMAIDHLPILAVEDHAGLSALKADVALDLSSRAANAIDPASARHGVWFPDCPDALANLVTIASGAPTARIALFRRTASAATAHGVAVAFLNPKFLAARNALFMREKLVALIIQALRRTWLRGLPDSPEAIATSTRASPTPRDLGRYLKGLLYHVSQKVQDWFATRAGKRPGMFFLQTESATWQKFSPENASPHISKTDSYYADPFLWEAGGEVFCFFEEFVYRSGRGHISVGRLADGLLSDVTPVLQTDYHLSFPNLFEHQGVLYMLPETHQMQRLEVWRCVEFPLRWTLHATAFEGVTASDSTLNLIDGEWWLFTNISRDPFCDMNTELHLFRVDGPDLNRIEPHRANPVVMDTRCARNAGRILCLDGKRIRPAQENSHGVYGYGLKLMEIQQLSLDDYAEEEVRSFAPDRQKGIIACHHFDTRGGLVVTDACKRMGGRAG
jgi:hypothetical protein